MRGDYMQPFQVRAFAGWPGTRAKVAIVDDENDRRNIVELKIITTRVCDRSIVQGDEADDITYVKDSLVFPCGRSTALEVCSAITCHHIFILLLICNFSLRLYFMCYPRKCFRKSGFPPQNVKWEKKSLLTVETLFRCEGMLYLSR